MGVKKKHVLFIVENNAVPLDVRVWNEALAVKEMGYHVSVICPNEKSFLRFEKLEGISIYSHWMPLDASGKFSFLIEYGLSLFWELLISLWIFIRKPFHYIHSANPPDHIFIIAIFFKLAGVKYIFDHHDISPENYVAKFGKKDFFYKMLLLMEKLTFKTADIVISTNESYRKIAIDRGQKNKNDVFVVRNGPNLSNVIFIKPNDKLKEGFDYLVTYVGSIGNQEGIDNLLYAAEYLVHEKNITNIKFIIVGTGPHRKNLVEMSAQLKLDKYVVFTGYIPYKDFYEIIATADLCVNPEHCNDFTKRSTMLKIMDYMVFGKPIIQFETIEGKVTAENASLYVGENDNALFADTIVDLLNDPQKRKQMGEIGQYRIKELLNWDIQKTYLKKAYEHLETIT